ncbi:MAG: hypothetical protein K2M84_06845 [Anaeroplasmataceae bacterium]|nr:hypothetical protein [Anaeroplasmataceae bacterium]
MKKIILVLCALLGLVSLTACDGETSITYVDNNGEEQVLKVTATNDKETIQTVMDFASKANYDDIESFTVKESVSLNGSFSEETKDILGYDTKIKLSGSADMTLKASKTDGLDFSASGKVALGKELQGSIKIDALYEGNLEKMTTSEEYLYLNASYDVKALGESSKSDIKLAGQPEVFIGQVEDELDKLFPTNIPSIGDDFGSMSVDEFYEAFENSELTISSVKNGIIYLEVNMALKDVIKDIDVDLTELPLFLLNSDFAFTFGIEASTGRFREFSYKFDDVNLINTVISTLLSGEIFAADSFASMKFVESFLLENKLTIEYNKAKIRTLSATEKAKYEVVE